jgi:hypothetical protein
MSGTSVDGQSVAVELAVRKPPVEQRASCGLAIVLSGGHRIEVQRDFDVHTLPRLVSVLESGKAGLWRKLPLCGKMTHSPFLGLARLISLGSCFPVSSNRCYRFERCKALAAFLQWVCSPREDAPICSTRIHNSKSRC